MSKADKLFGALVTITMMGMVVFTMMMAVGALCM
jgi:hypothetical protein